MFSCLISVTNALPTSAFWPGGDQYLLLFFHLSALHFLSAWIRIISASFGGCDFFVFWSFRLLLWWHNCLFHSVGLSYRAHGSWWMEQVDSFQIVEFLNLLELCCKCRQLDHLPSTLAEVWLIIWFWIKKIKHIRGANQLFKGMANKVSF